MPVDPFSFDLPSNPVRRAVMIAARSLLSKLLGLHELRAVYAQAQAAGADDFFERLVRVLNLQLECPEEALAHIPMHGPLVVAANHPHGALDGIVLTALLKRVRSDVRVLANYMLARIPEIREAGFFVDPFGGTDAAARSQSGLRAAHLWLRRGGALVTFPAGAVAHQRKQNGPPVDSVWNTTIARLAIHTGAAVVPICVGGSNSRVFYHVGRLHPSLRTLLLPRELLLQRGARVPVAIAPRIETRSWERHANTAQQITDAARSSVDALATAGAGCVGTTDQDELVAREVSLLPDESLLVENGAYRVFCAPASAIPATLREIGRLRAVTYRAAGEGTSADVDLDTFDCHYLHLFSWDRKAGRVVGAYRLGLTDRITAEHGVAGLYTRTLFVYDAGLLRRLPPALELGRSFVRLEYQRQHQALLLLWKGIGHFVARNPRYRVLFGPVSISARYSNASHGLLTSFLEQNHLAPELAAMVRPTHPFARPHPESISLPCTVEDADRVISRLEADGKGMPVLLRQYLKLNARAIAFNVDSAFGDVLDALMLVDLTTVEPAILSRYLGREEATAFFARHAGTSRAA
jgi:putative hemolysin